jgi:hypothetical protein
MQKRFALFVVAALFAIPLTDLHAASDECLAGPNRSPPEGMHWYYRVDRDTHRKCWYLGEQGTKVRHAARAKPTRAARARTESVDTIPARSDPQQVATTTLMPQDLGLSRATAPAASSQTTEAPSAASDASTGEESQPVSAAANESIMPSAEAPVSASAAEPVAAAVPAGPPVSSKLMLALLGGALALAAVIGRAIFRHADSPRVFRRDVMDQVATTRSAPLADERLMPRVLHQEPPRRQTSNREKVAPPQRGGDDEDLDAVLRDLHRAWQRVAA